MAEINANHKNIKQLLKTLRFPQMLKAKITEKRFSLSSLSEYLGKHHTYFQRSVNNYDHQVSLIIALSIALHTNMFEPFINLLPEELRITQREKELQAQITDLEKQLAELGKERDIYKSIVLQTRQ